MLHAVGSAGAVEDRKLDREPGVTIGVTLLHVEGRGHVHAKSSDPKAAPAIWHNLLATETDRRAGESVVGGSEGSPCHLRLPPLPHPRVAFVTAS